MIVVPCVFAVCSLIGWAVYIDYKAGLDRCKHTFEVYEKLDLKSYATVRLQGVKYVSRCSKCGEFMTKTVYVD